MRRIWQCQKPHCCESFIKFSVAFNDWVTWVILFTALHVNATNEFFNPFWVWCVLILENCCFIENALLFNSIIHWVGVKKKKKRSTHMNCTHRPECIAISNTFWIVYSAFKDYLPSTANQISAESCARAFHCTFSFSQILFGNEHKVDPSLIPRALPVRPHPFDRCVCVCTPTFILHTLPGFCEWPVILLFIFFSVFVVSVFVSRVPLTKRVQKFQASAADELLSKPNEWGPSSGRNWRIFYSLK